VTVLRTSEWQQAQQHLSHLLPLLLPRAAVPLPLVDMLLHAQRQRQVLLLHLLACLLPTLRLLLVLQACSAGQLSIQIQIVTAADSKQAESSRRS
jgi:hypothetical protein